MPYNMEIVSWLYRLLWRHFTLCVCVEFVNVLRTNVLIILFVLQFCWDTRPHRMHSVHTVRPIATAVARNVVSLYVCLSVRRSHGRTVQKRLNRSRCRFVWGLTLVGPRNHVLDGGQIWTSPFAAVRGDKSAMWCGLLSNYFGHFVFTLFPFNYNVTTTM